MNPLDDLHPMNANYNINQNNLLSPNFKIDTNKNS